MMVSRFENLMSKKRGKRVIEPKYLKNNLEIILLTLLFCAKFYRAFVILLEYSIFEC